MCWYTRFHLQWVDGIQLKNPKILVRYFPLLPLLVDLDVDGV